MSIAFKIKVAGKDVNCAWSHGAQYRAGSLDRPPSMEDFADRRKVFASAVAWLWACLVDKRDKAKWPTPEAFAEDATQAELSEGLDALIEVISPSEKNADGSTHSHSPASS